MIVLTVLSYSGVPAEGLSAQFDELGGTIGRADNNQLVVPDPERSISRMHAKVVFRAGQYAIVDNGSNPIAVNGSQVPLGREHPLRPGDQLQIGSYVLAVSQPAAAGARSSNPFDDLFGDAVQGLAVPAAAPAPPAAAPSWGAPPAPWGAPPAPAVANPWPAPAAAPASSWPPAPAAPAAPASPALAPARIPDDWDDLLAPIGTPAAAAPSSPAAFGSPAPADPFGLPAAAPSPGLGLPMGNGALDSLDDLFGLGPPAPGGDPLGAAPQQALLLQPNMGAHADPLQSIGRPAAISVASTPDHVSELNTPMPLPRHAAPPAAPAAPPAINTPPSGAIFSWDDPPRDGRVVTLPGMPRGQSRAADVPVAFDAPGAPSGASPLASPLAESFASSVAPQARRAAPLELPAQMPMPAAAPAQRAPGSDDALLGALLQGLDAPGLRIDALSPALMLLIGQLLRESTRGAVELLLARAALKREMRAQMTMISARENNPLKFSPSPEAALQHLLSPPAPGVMAPAPAMRDAFDDLRAHQMGVMAGMRAALEGVLQRFDPQHLEAKLSKRSAIDSLIPATRKARLWEAFQQLFGQLSNEAQDDFDELFGKAFLAAYEEQLDRLSAENATR
jgi:type VI secretion system FHA domain protein